MARTPIYHEEKKAQIVQAALATFTKHGYEGTTNKLIAKEAAEQMGQSVSPALIYHYFPEGKVQLFGECIEQFPSLQHFVERVKANLEEPPEVFLRVVAQTYNEVLKTDGFLPIMRLVLSEGARQPELLHTLLSKLGPRLFHYILLYIEKQIQAGHTTTQKPDQIGLQIVGPLFMRRTLLSLVPDVALFPLDRFLISSDEEFIESVVQSVLKNFFNG